MTLHNDLIEFAASPAKYDKAALQGMLLHCQVYNHQLPDLYAAWYDILSELDGATAAQLQERLLSPANTFRL